MNPAVPGVPGLATHAGARRLHAGVGIALVVVSALVAVLLLREARALWAAARHWTHHTVVVEGLADDEWVEVELPAAAAARLPALHEPPHASPSRDDHVRRLLPRPPYFGAWLRDEVTLAHDPTRPADLAAVRLLDPWAIAVPLGAKALLLALLAAAGWAWRRLPWGRDQTWSGGRWVDTATTAHRAGLAATPEGELREPQAHFAGTRFWAFVIGTLGVLGLVAVVTGWSEGPVESGGLLLLLVLGLGFMAHVFVSTRTRRWRFDAQGLADGSFFATRRMPWSAVAAFEKVNLNADAQRRHDDAWRQSSRRSGTARRPRDLWMWELRATDGTVLTRLPHELEGSPAFAALQARLRRLTGGGTMPGGEGGEVGELAGDDLDEDDDDPAAQAEYEAARARFEQHERRFRRGAAVAAVVVLLPFVLPTLWGTVNALRWAWGSERVEGRVVAWDGEQPPSLTVAWRGADGREQRLVTGGSDYYAHLVPGQPVTVLVRGPTPEDARMDHFLEVWLLPTIGWVLTAIVLLPVLLVGRGLRRRD